MAMPSYIALPFSIALPSSIAAERYGGHLAEI